LAKYFDVVYITVYILAGQVALISLCEKWTYRKHKYELWLSLRIIHPCCAPRVKYFMAFL